MAEQQTEFADLIDRYFRIWNETDTERRAALIATTWSDTGTYRDPALAGTGHAEIDALVQGTQARFPGYRFRQLDTADGYGDRVRFRWELAPEHGPALAAGTDFGIVAPDGRLAHVTGFWDQVAQL